jgi:hypothetical protein
LETANGSGLVGRSQGARRQAHRPRLWHLVGRADRKDHRVSDRNGDRHGLRGVQAQLLQKEDGLPDDLRDETRGLQQGAGHADAVISPGIAKVLLLPTARRLRRRAPLWRAGCLEGAQRSTPIARDSHRLRDRPLHTPSQILGRLGPQHREHEERDCLAGRTRERTPRPHAESSSRPTGLPTATLTIQRSPAPIDLKSISWPIAIANIIDG